MLFRSTLSLSDEEVRLTLSEPEAAALEALLVGSFLEVTNHLLDLILRLFFLRILSPLSGPVNK